MDMSFVERLKAEHDELKDRLTKLSGFIGSASFEKLEAVDKSLLQLQARQMAALLGTLAVRYSPYVEELPPFTEEDTTE